MSLVTTLLFCKFQIANKADKSQNQKKSLFFEKKTRKTFGRYHKMLYLCTRKQEIRTTLTKATNSYNS